MLKLFVNKVGNYCFLKVISSNQMSTKENTLQLPPQFPCNSTSESDSETQISFIKIGKNIMYNNIYTNFMKAIVILFLHFYL